MSSKRPLPDTDEVARLIRMAGGRPEPPPDVAARAKGAVRNAWQVKTRRRLWRRRVWTGVGLTAAASLILAVGLAIGPRGTPNPATAMPSARVTSLVGKAWIKSAGGAEAAVLLQTGDSISAASEIVTEGNGQVGLASARGYSIRLDSDSRILVESESRIDLASGALYFDSGSETRRDANFEVRTVYGVAHPVGTQFEVRLMDDSVRVRVRRGTVELAGTGGSHAVPAGSELQLDQLGSASRRAVPVFGIEWAWVEQVTSSFDMDGSSLRALLDWASRERGWRLAFADEETARMASEIVLTGSTEGMTVEEALSAVLPTCSMVHTVDRGVLTVHQATGSM